MPISSTKNILSDQHFHQKNYHKIVKEKDETVGNGWHFRTSPYNSSDKGGSGIYYLNPEFYRTHRKPKSHPKNLPNHHQSVRKLSDQEYNYLQEVLKNHHEIVGRREFDNSYYPGKPRRINFNPNNFPAKRPNQVFPKKNFWPNLNSKAPKNRPEVILTPKYIQDLALTTSSESRIHSGSSVRPRPTYTIPKITWVNADQVSDEVDNRSILIENNEYAESNFSDFYEEVLSREENITPEVVNREKIPRITGFELNFSDLLTE